ncbi:MAG: hypothetical protein AAF939_03515 [Planctomycetota bacterium]
MSKTKLFVIENHHQLYDIWEDYEFRNISVTHLDFHCDMRGIMVDPKRQLGYRIPDVRKGVDMGNFLAHAVFDGFVNEIKWIYDTPGGRKWDIHTIKHTSDFTSMPYKFLANTGAIRPFEFPYQEVLMKDWQGVGKGEFLDIDWDIFAALEIDQQELEERVDSFFQKTHHQDVVGISICYSPHHIHSSQPQFQQFVDQVAALFNAEIIEEKERTAADSNCPSLRKWVPDVLYQPMQQVYYKARLTMKQYGVY